MNSIFHSRLQQRLAPWAFICVFPWFANVLLGKDNSLLIVQHTINDGAPQCSVVTNISLFFSSDIHLSANNIVIRNLSNSVPIATKHISFAYDAASNKATITFPSLPAHSLPDGNYIIALRSTEATNAAGHRLDGNNDGRPGDPYVFELFRYFGDWNGDRDIDFWDNYWFRRVFESRSESAGTRVDGERAVFDFDGDGLVNSNDLPYFSAHYFTILPLQACVFADLVNDTGFSPWDYYTADPTIAGAVVQTSIVASFECGLNGRTLVRASGDMDPAGGFWFTPVRLGEINGSPLSDGTHILACRTTTTNGQICDFNLRFILDRAAPDTFIDSHPLHPTNETVARFTFHGSDAITPSDHLRFECRHAYTNRQAGLSNQPSFVTEWFPCQSPQVLSNLHEGFHAYEVRAIDLAGNVDPSPASYTWFVDLTPPDTFIVVRPPRVTNVNDAVIEWTNDEPVNVQCRLDNGVWVDCSSPVVLTNLPEGIHRYDIQPFDPSGNPGPITSITWTNDYSAPSNAMGSCPFQLSNQQTEVFEFFGTDNFTAPTNLVFECRYTSANVPVDATNWSRCTSPVILTNLQDGTNMFEVRAMDEAGNVDPTPAKCTWVVAAPPDTFIISGPPTNAQTGTARFEFHGTDNSTTPGNLVFQCRVDGGVPFPCSSPQILSNLMDGPHVFAVWAIDEAGNADPTPATFTWGVTASGAVSRAWPFPNYDERGTRLYPPTRTDVAGRPFQVQWRALGVAGALTGDSDGDGQLEVVTADASSIHIYSSAGTRLNTLTNVSGLNILGDVTGDGNVEILVSGISGATVWVRAYAMDGTLVRTFSKNGSTDSGIFAWMCGDLNNDGTNEVVAQVHSGFSQSIRGTVIFNGATGSDVGFLNTGPFVRGPVSVGDVNGDGIREILHGSGGPWNGKIGSDGSSDCGSYIWLLRPNATTAWRRGPFNSCGFFDANAMLADLEHDGAMDVIACPSSHGFGFWDGNVGRVMLLEAANGSTRAGYDRNFGRPVEVVAVGDLETGGNDEIVIRHKDGGAQKFYLRILRATNELPDVTLPLDMGAQASTPTLCDIDGDGQVEMLVALGSRLNVLHIAGNSLVQEWAWSCPDDTNRPVHTPIVTDLDGNGINEIIVSCGSSFADYGLYVLSVPLNRPPAFASAPVAEARATNVVVSQPFDLSSWSTVRLTTTENTAPNWVRSSSVATQTVNADASIFLSEIDVARDRIEGTWSVQTTVDDDFIGFVFGYQDPQHFYLFDWKRLDQPLYGGLARQGMSVKVLHTSSPTVGEDLWPTVPTDTNRVQTIYTNRTSWVHRREYGFQVQFSPGAFTITIRDGTNTLETISLTNSTYSFGRFGFYNFSQEQVRYSGFTRTPQPTFSYVYDADATDPDGDTISYVLISGPPGMTINPQTGVVLWNGTAELLGDHNVTIEASDGHGGTARQSFIVTVHPASTNGLPLAGD